MKSFLIIQTAFIGDVILATAVAEKIMAHHPDASIDFLVRKGNETLFENNPNIRTVLIWNKKENKILNLFKTINSIRKNKYEYVINIHRFESSGLITFLSGSKNKIGFKQNPFSFCYTKSVVHDVKNSKHEIERNQSIIASLTDNKPALPKVYPSTKDFDFIKKFQQKKYFCIAPSSVWFTKQLPKEKWIELINKLDNSATVYLLGAANDKELCNNIINETKKGINLCGELTFMQSAALMKNAEMNFANDSAPIHLASAVDAPMRAFFCSTIPEFGFGPLSSNKKIIQTAEKLTCRPCGLNGYNKCPEGHFKCGFSIDINTAIN